MATIVADDALAEAAGAPIDVDILEIKLTAFLSRVGDCQSSRRLIEPGGELLSRLMHYKI